MRPVYEAADQGVPGADAARRQGAGTVPQRHRLPAAPAATRPGRRPTPPRWRGMGWGLACGLLAGAAALAGIVLWIQGHYDRQVWTNPGDLPDQPVAIVFGAGVTADGRLTPMLADRVDTAISLYRAGKVRKLLMSGDNRFAWYDEPTRMYEYAVARGVPPEDIVRDFAGRRTYDTCYRAGAIFGVRQAVLVTQRFHLPRALFTCNNLGIDAVGLSADRRVYASNPFYQARDLVATLVAWWDVKVTRPLPVLGEKIDIGI